ncbi:MAG: NYN domain-containing protein [Thermodesulfovibrionales bacterium]
MVDQDPHNPPQVFFYFSVRRGILLPSLQFEVTIISFILIDGYNLIGTAHSDLRAERNGLVSQLSAYHKTKGHDITLVFDGWQSGSQHEVATTVAGIKIIYSRLGDKADLVIKRIIDAAHKELIVITSDRDIMAHAWAKGCVPVQSYIFEPYLNKNSSDPGPFEEPAEEDEPETRKGNPRMPSRREKTLSRVLKKL